MPIAPIISGGVARPHDRDDPKVDEIATQAIEMAFGHQDKPMIKAQAEMIRNLGGEDINDIDYVPLPFDAGPARIRQLLRELLEAQTIDNSGLPNPLNPYLEKLIS